MKLSSTLTTWFQLLFFVFIVAMLISILIANIGHNLARFTTAMIHESPYARPITAYAFYINNLCTTYKILGYVLRFVGMEMHRLFWLLKIQKDQFMVDMHHSLGKGTVIFMVTWRLSSSSYILKHPFSALQEQTGICNGYALLSSKYLLCFISSQYVLLLISGTINGSLHHYLFFVFCSVL